MKKIKKIIVFISVLPLALMYAFFISLADSVKSFAGTMEDFFNEFNDII
jgi:hypothetical protein